MSSFRSAEVPSIQVTVFQGFPVTAAVTLRVSPCRHRRSILGTVARASQVTAGVILRVNHCPPVIDRSIQVTVTPAGRRAIHLRVCLHLRATRHSARSFRPDTRTLVCLTLPPFPARPCRSGLPATLMRVCRSRRSGDGSRLVGEPNPPSQRNRNEPLGRSPIRHVASSRGWVLWECPVGFARLDLPGERPLYGRSFK